MNIQGKNVVLGIAGGIAAYKICELIRLLVKDGVNVDAILTRAGKEFITPLTVQTLTSNPVYMDMFSIDFEPKIGHISLAQRADLIVVAPATADIIAKVANGICDDLLTTTICATKAPVLFVPSMNVNMWENPILQENINKIKKFYQVMEPQTGLLACGDYGKGKLPDIEDIFEEIKMVISPKPLLNKKVLVTAGPTIEEIDPVRFISNYSSGKMGYWLARIGRRLGANVTLVSGPVSLKKPYGVNVIDAKSAKDMHKAVLSDIKSSDIIIMAAAVADYRPVKRAEQKIKKSDADMVIQVTKNVDILKDIAGKRKDGSLLIGFAAETENLIENARKKLKEKKLDFIVANQIGEEGSGFQVDTNRATIIGKKIIEKLPLMSKEELAYKIFEIILK